MARHQSRGSCQVQSGKIEFEEQVFDMERLLHCLGPDEFLSVFLLIPRASSEHRVKVCDRHQSCNSNLAFDLVHPPCSPTSLQKMQVARHWTSRWPVSECGYSYFARIMSVTQSCSSTLVFVPANPPLPKSLQRVYSPWSILRHELKQGKCQKS